MAKTKPRSVMVGDTVIWYPRGKVQWNTGEPVVVKALYLGANQKSMVQLSRIIGPCEHIDNVWHSSFLEDRNLLSEETVQSQGVWSTVAEHHALYEAEIDRIEGGKERQREAAKQKELAVENRRAAVSAVKSGEKLEDVAERFEIDAMELANHVEMGV